MCNFEKVEKAAILEEMLNLYINYKLQCGMIIFYWLNILETKVQSRVMSYFGKMEKLQKYPTNM